MSFIPPSTPPTKRKNHSRTPGFLKTPQTVRAKDFFPNKMFKTSKIHRSEMTHLLPATPDITPHKHRRRRSYVEDIFKSSSSVSENSPASSPKTIPSFLLPAPSTVGTGRVTQSPTKKRPAHLNFESLADLHDSLNYESDEEAPFVLNKNLLSMHKNPFLVPDSPTRRYRGPQTPSKQLIDDEKIQEWHGKSAKGCFTDSEDDEDDEPLVNPFISSAEQGKAVSFSNIPQSGVDYSTHVEYLNNRTGQRKVVELSERQKRIRPKKLNFTAV